MAFSMRGKDLSISVFCFDVYFCPIPAQALNTRKASWSIVLRILQLQAQCYVTTLFPIRGSQTLNVVTSNLHIFLSLAQSISNPAVKVITMVCAKCQKLKSTSLATPAVKKKNEMYYGSPAGSTGRVEKSSATNGSAAAGKVC